MCSKFLGFLLHKREPKKEPQFYNNDILYPSLSQILGVPTDGSYSGHLDVNYFVPKETISYLPSMLKEQEMSFDMTNNFSDLSHEEMNE